MAHVVREQEAGVQTPHGAGGESRASRWRRIEPHLDRALDVATDARAAWLAAFARVEPALADELRDLLAERALLSQEGFLAGGAPPIVSLAGQEVGPYTLLAPIGEGGMGSVWLARRNDGRFEGQVAIKLLNYSLVGRPAGARFRREGGILARLRHPHIAHLMDAGVSAQGQPYLVLEHIDGEPIDAYCDTRRLGVAARVRLFNDVLAAVAHAHANLIVHRDIKPSNVLVTRAGVVKLLDFGIAKLLEPQTPAVTSTLTREAGVALTPRYAAPEQLTGGEVTTATDVFALGVLLFELLEGRHPHGDAQSPARVVKAIVDEPPARLGELAPSDGQALLRGSTPPRLRRELRGDLETIVGRALKKDPLERYASVAALAEDLRRHQQALPVSARPDTMGYRAAKFVRRNRLAVALSAVTGAVLLAGLFGTFTQAQRANRQRDFALRQLARAEAINDLNRFVLSDAAPSGRPFTAGELLARAEQLIAQQEDAADDDSRVELLLTVGHQYQVMDEHGKSLRLLRQAHTLASHMPDQALQGKAACARAAIEALTGNTAAAAQLLAEGERLVPHEPQFATYRIFCQMRASLVAREGGDGAGGIARMHEARRLLGQLRFPSPLLELTAALNLAEAYRMNGDARAADRAFAEGQRRLRALGREGTDKEATLLNNWALVLEDLGRPADSARLLRRAIEIGSDGQTDSASPMVLSNYGRVLRELDRLPEAQAMAQAAYAGARRAGNDRVTNQTLTLRASIARLQGDLAGAEALNRELAARVATYPEAHPARGGLLASEWALAQARGDWPAAHRLADQTMKLARARGPVASAHHLRRRAELFLAMNRLDDARADAQQALALAGPMVDAGAWSSVLGLGHATLGRVLRAQGQGVEAERAFATALPHLRETLGDQHRETRAVLAARAQHD